MKKNEFIQLINQTSEDTVSSDWVEGILNHPSMKNVLKHYEPIDFEISRSLINVESNLSGTQILKLKRKVPGCFFPINNIGFLLQDALDSFDTQDWGIKGSYQINSEYIILYQSFIA